MLTVAKGWDQSQGLEAEPNIRIQRDDLRVYFFGSGLSLRLFAAGTPVIGANRAPTARPGARH